VAVQFTSNAVETVLSATMCTVRGFVPPTEQLAITPESSTVWLPSERREKVANPSGPMSFAVESSTTMLYPSESRSSPDVEALTRRLPTGVRSPVTLD